MTDETASTATAATTTAATTAATTTTTSTTGAADTTASTTTASAETTTASTEQAQSAEFKIPDAWKDKPWASKVKSQEDLYKQIDGLDQLKGKKTLTIDYANSTPEEISAHHAALAPKDVAEYSFDKVEGVNPETMAKVAPILQKAGLTVHQAQEVAKNYAVYENQVLAEATSEEGFNAVMEKSFGKEFKPAVAAVVAVHEANLSAEDKQLFEAMPNEYLAGVYRFTAKIDAAHKAEIAALKKQYGAEENGTAHLDKNGQPPAVADVEKQRAEYRKQLRELDGRAHSAEEKQKLLDALDATYKNQQGKK